MKRKYITTQIMIVCLGNRNINKNNLLSIEPVNKKNSSINNEPMAPVQSIAIVGSTNQAA